MRGLVRASRLCFVGVGEPTLGVGVQQMQYEEDAHCLLFVVPFPPASHHLSSPQTNPPRLVYTDPNDLQKCAQSYVTATVWKPIAGVAGGGSWIGGEGKTSCSPCPNHSVTVAEGSADVSGAALLRVVCAGRGDCLCSCVLGCVAFLGLLRQHVPSCMHIASTRALVSYLHIRSCHLHSRPVCTSACQCSRGYQGALRLPTNSSTWGLECKACPVGYASSLLGAAAPSDCTICAAGSYADRAGSSSCAKCAAGKYQPSSGATACLSCAGEARGAVPSRPLRLPLRFPLFSCVSPLVVIP